MNQQSDSGDCHTPFADVVDLLRCPNCHAELEVIGDRTGVACTSGHTFDRARGGYLTLFGPRGRRHGGDSTEQISCRDRVFEAGHFDSVRAAVTQSLLTHLGQNPSTFGGLETDSEQQMVIADIGAGTGAYLADSIEAIIRHRTVRSEPRGIGIDISVPAAKRIARSHPLAAAVVADTWEELPLRTGSVDFLLDVFAPRNPAEFARVLAKTGAAVIVTPAEGHLHIPHLDSGIVKIDPQKTQRLETSFANDWQISEPLLVTDTLRLSAVEFVDMVRMGPAGVHYSHEEVSERVALKPQIQDLDGMLSVPVRVEVRTAVLR